MSPTYFRVIDQPIYFSDADAAQAYAKNNPGVTITRVDTDKEPSLQISPESILEHLNKSIIAQSDAKKEIATAMYYHALKTKYKHAKEIQSSGPVMLIGPTGSGKTFVVQQACKHIDTLFIHVDTSSMVAEGIVGYNVGKLAADIVKEAEFNKEKAETCVVFFDEMDKLFYPDDDEYGLEVSHQLLRFIEGTTIQIPNQAMGEFGDSTLSTNRMQFILGGAFQWILDKKNEILFKQRIGFLNTSMEQTNINTKTITLEDLYKENVPKELLGRMHAIVNLYALNRDDYYKILTQSDKSPLKEFVAKVEFHGDEVKISDDVIQSIAAYAATSELGVRAIRQVLKRLFAQALFEAPSHAKKTHEIVWI